MCYQRETHKRYPLWHACICIVLYGVVLFELLRYLKGCIQYCCLHAVTLHTDMLYSCPDVAIHVLPYQQYTAGMLGHSCTPDARNLGAIWSSSPP